MTPEQIRAIVVAECEARVPALVATEISRREAIAKAPKLCPLDSDPPYLRTFVERILDRHTDRRSHAVSELCERRFFATPAMFTCADASAVAERLRAQDLGDGLPASAWRPLMKGT